MFKGCRQEIVALTEIDGVKGAKVGTKLYHSYNSDSTRDMTLLPTPASSSSPAISPCQATVSRAARQPNSRLQAAQFHSHTLLAEHAQARLLFQAGIRSPEMVATKTPDELAVILKQGGHRSLASTRACSGAADIISYTEGSHQQCSGVKQSIQVGLSVYTLVRNDLHVLKHRLRQAQPRQRGDAGAQDLERRAPAAGEAHPRAGRRGRRLQCDPSASHRSLIKMPLPKPRCCFPFAQLSGP